jgi:Asp-tRNA(Asn)/Glu-tRNA(Gln) amidotransferase A subunit family amidase
MRHCEERVRHTRDAADDRRLAAAILAWRTDDALADARAWDAAANPPALFGLTMSVKACVDVAGWVTHAGSRALADAAPASHDAPIVASLRAAGALVVAQTNMTEFAFSGLGVNPHYGTPRSPLYATADRIAGGSSSGAAVTVATGVVDTALGTDTSGSVRIPAAFCGVVGFKPSAGRYPTAGIVPLAPSFDTPGMIARSVTVCDHLDASLTVRAARVSSRPLTSIRLVVPRGFIAARLDGAVATVFDRAVHALAAAGVHIEESDMGYLAEVGEVARQGGVVAAEAFLWHEPLLERRAAVYDPRVGARIAVGATVRATDYIRAKRRLHELWIQYSRDMHGFDALVTPTVALEPPAIGDLAEDLHYFAINQRVLYFTELANRIDVPSISIPVGDGSRAVGLLLTGLRGADVELLALARAVEGT